MKRVLVVFAVWALLCRMASAQGILPYVEGTFTANNGTPLALGKICTTTSGGSTNLPTYPTYADAVAGTNANANPVVLDAYGRANIWLPGGTAYRIRIIAAGVGGTACNGDSAVGVDIKIIDGVTTGVSVINALTINGVQMCDQYPGSTAGAKIAACVAALPVAGGVADAIGIQGPQTISSDPFGGSTKPVTLLLGAATFTVSDTIILPPSSQIIGLGKATKMVSASTSAPAAEMIRMNGDYTTLRNFWMYGSGQGSGSAVNGIRGVWIGSCADHTMTCYTDYATVENLIIEQFQGNGISGDYRYSTIKNNVIRDNTDANLFSQPTCQYNLIEGNLFTGSRYAGYDNNGSFNKVIGNTANANATGGNLDPYAKAGFLVATSNVAFQSASYNQYIGNSADGGATQVWGILLYDPSPTTSALWTSGFGNTVIGGALTNHTVQYTEGAGVTITSWGAGLGIYGTRDTVATGVTSEANTFNFVVAGVSNGTDSKAERTRLTGNISRGAVTNAALTGLSLPSGVGYFYPMSARVDDQGGYAAQKITSIGNSDYGSASDGFQWFAGVTCTSSPFTCLVWQDWIISGDSSDTAGRYGFNVAYPGAWSNNRGIETTNVTSAVTASYNGLATNNGLGLTANSATPSVANSAVWFTQNTNPTTYTNFTGAAPWDRRIIRVADSVSTFDFSGSNLKGNFSTDYLAVSGDMLDCTFDATNWQCVLNNRGVATVFANTNQATDKTTTVVQNGVLSGRITLCTDATCGASANNPINAGATTSFDITNNAFTTSRDMVVGNVSGGPNLASYTVVYADGGANTITVNVRNNTAGNLDDAIVLDYEIRKR